MATEQGLLVLLSSSLAVASRTRARGGTSLGSLAGAEREGLGELAGAALEEARDVGAGLSTGDGGGLGHEVEVEELDELELDVAAGAAAAEQRGDGQQAVEVLESARVARRVDEGCD